MPDFCASPQSTTSLESADTYRRKHKTATQGHMFYPPLKIAIAAPANGAPIVNIPKAKTISSSSSSGGWGSFFFKVFVVVAVVAVFVTIAVRAIHFIF